MSFQIKDFLSIVAAMVNHMRGTQVSITDFNVGSVARTLIEAPAIEIDELYQQMFHGLREAVPVSVYNSFDFTRLLAIGASGLVRFTADPAAVADIAIPAGTIVRAPGGSYDYATSVDAVIATGTTQADVMVYCTQAGAATNTGAETLTEMASPIATVTVTNLTAFSNGQDIETDTDRKVRFQNYISTIARGTVAALDYGARTAALLDAEGVAIERVALATVVEPYLIDPLTYAPGQVNIYIHNGTSGTSAGLVAECQKVIDGYRDADGTPIPGWKAAGVVVTVAAATDVSIDVNATLTVLDAYDSATCAAAAETAMRDYIDGLGIGAKVVLAELIAAAMEVPGVYNVSITLPVADTLVDPDKKAVSGSVTVIA